ncbi:uncharacterized protein A4U43_C07F21720 [Asparagus officinalis]|uniref:Anaphase-promoting complex subunit 4 WD40 domain-containing protein n=1 Tax=Asparagus officinalis TaxID=4686 RepID=A0A5P1EE03_ASPOF|nr:uncharacterized protein A4U43_C07F21720 [Asparagus officinalis]
MSTAMWDVSNGEEVRAYRGHRNARSFVGMDVCNGGGLIGSGSESNEVFVYDLRWGDPIWVQDFGEEDEGEFVSAVCWREIGENECALVAGGREISKTVDRVNARGKHKGQE